MAPPVRPSLVLSDSQGESLRVPPVARNASQSPSARPPARPRGSSLGSRVTAPAPVRVTTRARELAPGQHSGSLSVTSLGPRPRRPAPQCQAPVGRGPGSLPRLLGLRGPCLRHRFSPPVPARSGKWSGVATFFCFCTLHNFIRRLGVTDTLEWRRPPRELGLASHRDWEAPPLSPRASHRPPRRGTRSAAAGLHRTSRRRLRSSGTC